MPFFNDPFFRQFFGNQLPEAPREQRQMSLGSGVIFASDGYIITNNHVIADADEIRITLYDKRTFKGTVVGADPKTDLAVIKIPASSLPAVRWGDSDKLEVGEFVLAIGNPYMLGHTVTMGIISAVGRANVGIADYEDFIQTDAAINPGNSGGPLVNVKGEVIGINTAIFSKNGGYQGIGFAIPSNMVLAVKDQLISTGRVVRGWLGVNAQELTPEMGRKFGLENSSGALVSDVTKDGPAYFAGIKRGDVITEFNNQPIADPSVLKNVVAAIKPGSAAPVTIVRQARVQKLNVNVIEYPFDNARAQQPAAATPVGGKRNAFAGLNVMEITREIAKQLDLGPDEGEQGSYPE
jgi:serine protease Do